MREDRMQLGAYLGKHVNNLLAASPFVAWDVTRSVENDLPRKEIWYEFEGHGIEVICDEDERVRTIFLHRGEAEALAEVSFAASRTQVVAQLGAPSKSGKAVRIPVLGDRGAWDRFTGPDCVIHVQYMLDRDEIDMVTLMRPDAVP